MQKRIISIPLGKIDNKPIENSIFFSLPRASNVFLAPPPAYQLVDQRTKEKETKDLLNGELSPYNYIQNMTKKKVQQICVPLGIEHHIQHICNHSVHQ